MFISEDMLYGITQYSGYYDGSGEHPYSIDCEGWTLSHFDQWVDPESGEPRWKAVFFPSPPVTSPREDLWGTPEMFVWED
jgi:hypothetical protein